ncbi:arsenate reductase ArsC [Microbulbifer variabilis]|uniref:arsenate reductase ArsC n=1 Tax=Microbulbifer variabilis TaxID=266805 RepID=UPI00035D61A1|nr:arsenate reductase ArsC [Microbulbifer variabilis]
MKKRVLFICAGNSARSIIAEALLRYHSGAFFEVASAGTSPEPVDIRAISALKRFGIPIQGLYSKSLDEVSNQSFDLVITLCDKSQREYVPSPTHSKIIAWDFEDPATRHCFNPFYTTVRELSTRIKLFALVQTKTAKAA